MAKQSSRQKKKPELILFDLDHTLLAGDSDFAWGGFLTKVGAVDEDYQKQNAHFYHLYRTQKLDINDYIRFALRPLTNHPIEQLQAWRQEFIATVIRPMVNRAARNLIATHQAQGHITVIITATNSFIVEPIAELLAVQHLIATEVEKKDGVYSGSILGVPCFHSGKVTCFKRWLKTHNPVYGSSWFYSDSINDLPLLEYVDHAVVVDGDEELLRRAKNKNWPCISLRHNHHNA